MKDKVEIINILVSFTDPKEIGNDGWNSKTYLAKDKLQRDIVIKEIEKKEGWDLEDYYEEAKILNEMKHPNVVEIQLAGEKILKNKEGFLSVDQVLLAMPYYKKGSLNDLIKNKSLSIKEKNQIMLGILHGLESIHRKRLIHLDLKPDNILISNNKDALISDFGVSKYLKKSRDYLKTRDLEKTGISPYLIPPEMLNVKKKHVSRRTDIWQLGLLMFSLYSDTLLEDIAGFTKTDLLNRNELPITKYYASIEDGTLLKKSDKIPKQIYNIIEKCLKVNPEERYSNVSEIHNLFIDIDN